MTGRAAARTTAGLIGAVMAFQLALLLGAPWGAYTQGGSTAGELPTSGRLLAALSFVLLGLMAGAMLARAGDGPLSRAPRSFVTVVAWASTGYLGLGILVNLVSPSPGERLLWVPMSAMSFAFALLTMIRTQRSR